MWTQSIKIAIQSLSKHNNVTITEADKEGVIVLFNTLDYINSCESLLLDTTKYKIVQRKRVKEFASEAKNIINYAHGTCAVFLKNTLPD